MGVSVGTLQSELLEARGQIERLTVTVRDQAKAIMELTDECPPWAPSVAIVYWLYAPTRQAEENWAGVWHRLIPVVNALGDLPAMKLTPAAWDAHVMRRKLATTRYGKPIKDCTINLELGRAKQMLRWAAINKLIKHNPLAPARRLRTISRRETWLPPDYIDRLLAAADGVVDKRKAEGEDDGLRSLLLSAFVLCCHDSMLRGGEAMNIRRRSIGPDGRVEVASREAKSRRRRTVYLTPRTLEAIAKIPIDGSEYVFARAGVRLGYRGMAYWFRECCKIAGVDALAAPGDVRARPHDIRASGATTADERGVRATAIQATLGHRHLATTEHYLRSGQASDAAAVSREMAQLPRRGPKRSAGRTTRREADFEKVKRGR